MTKGDGQRRLPAQTADQNAAVHRQQEAGHRDQERHGRRQWITGLGLGPQLVGHHAAQPDPDHAAQEGDARIVPRGFRQGQAKAPHEERGQPGRDAIAADR